MELLLFDILLRQAQALGLLKQRGRQRTYSTHVLAAVSSMNRLERVGETLRTALNTLAVAAPGCPRAVAEPDWFACCGSRVDNFNLPKTEAGRKQLAAVIRLDGRRLLHAISKADARLGLAKLPEVLLVERIWEQFVDDGGGQPCLRDAERMKSRGSGQLALRRGSSQASGNNRGSLNLG